MKKTYLTPELKVLQVEAATMICNSKIDLAQETTSTATNEEGDPDPITEADARRTTKWDDDEEED